MANLSISTEVNNNDDETHVTVDIQATETTEESDKTYRQKILHRVPPLRENKNHIYDPVVLSLGAYHHNLQSKRFFRVEELKTLILNSTLDPSTKGFFHRKILERVDEIRIFYGGLSIDEYEDEALVEVMLRDACFLLYYMELAIGDNEKKSHLFGRLGLSVGVFLDRDYFMLENQIPLWVIKLFITLKSNEKDEGEAFLRKFLSYICFADPEKLTRLPWVGKDQEPLHLLEAHRKSFIFKEDTSSEMEHRGRNIFELIKWRRTKSTFSTQSNTNFELGNGMFRSVTNLKAKGIDFGPSSYCLKDIRFNSHAFHGKLLLPMWFVNNNTNAFFSNMITLEMLPETDTNFDVLSYVNFMKSLLETPKDVKELREKGILFSSLRNDGEVLKVFKEIDTYGVNNEEFYFDVKMRINEHCDSKAKTWMAELIHTYFHSPWTAIALFAAAFLLFLTFLQTYYTMDPKKSN